MDIIKKYHELSIGSTITIRGGYDTDDNDIYRVDIEQYIIEGATEYEDFNDFIDITDQL